MFMHHLKSGAVRLSVTFQENEVSSLFISRTKYAELDMERVLIIPLTLKYTTDAIVGWATAILSLQTNDSNLK